MTDRWKPILSTIGLFCLVLPQARSQPASPQPTPYGEAVAETISHIAVAGAAVTAANATTRITATLAQTAIGPLLGSAISAGQGIWYALPRTSPAGEGWPADNTGSADPSLSLFPNPCSGSTQISFHISQAGPISLALYDLIGKPVRILLDEQGVAGTFNLRLETEELPSGRYTVILTEGEKQRTIPLQIVR